MLTSARNQFVGQITAIREGAVNDEIDIALAGGDQLVAVITRESTRSLGLATGGEAIALVKAPWVILANPSSGVKLSTRNRLEGTVSAINHGAVNTEVHIALKGGDALTAIVTQESARELGLVEGGPVVAFFKASHVIVGVRG
ncbi:TOBE domain-containing protein [Crenobacter cavernae]|uniref:Transporter n=1 Tax=Crenobacter cavernae TaxID=2290923 RepID=A0ABY0FC26_9NEIS|nr:TOBE domain-containing protein [Crenobacter cavernae]RXZ43615.1 transporter [Crenobacter cavernae]